ncbi:MAG: DUF3010 family protein [Motiliproteus sp.]
MRVCGIELKGGEAILCLLNLDDGIFNVAECRQRQYTVAASASTDSIREFHFSFSKLMQDYQIDEVVIIERHQKGKLAASATSFKLEAAIQLIEQPVTLITTATIKEQLKLNPLQVEAVELGLKKFQITAFTAAYAYQHQQAAL